MALIKCPECQQEISEQDEYCGYCGCQIVKVNNTRQEMKQSNNIRYRVKKNKNKIITFSVLTIIIALGISLFAYFNAQKKEAIKLNDTIKKITTVSVSDGKKLDSLKKQYEKTNGFQRKYITSASNLDAAISTYQCLEYELNMQEILKNIRGVFLDSLKAIGKTDYNMNDLKERSEKILLAINQLPPAPDKYRKIPDKLSDLYSSLSLIIEQTSIAHENIYNAKVRGEAYVDKTVDIGLYTERFLEIADIFAIDEEITDKNIADND